MIAGDNIVVGAYGASVNGNSLQGAAYVYTNVGGTWTFVKKLVADDGVGGEFFGRSVAMSGTRALVGAPYASVDGTAARGAVYMWPSPPMPTMPTFLPGPTFQCFSGE